MFTTVCTSVDRLNPSIVFKVSIVSSIAEKVSNVSSENVAKMTGYRNPSVWQNLVGIR